jgi:hypothetical protein
VTGVDFEPWDGPDGPMTDDSYTDPTLDHHDRDGDRGGRRDGDRDTTDIAAIRLPAFPNSEDDELKALDNRYTTGGSFILDRPLGVPAIWGSGGDVLWAEGEALMIVGPQGVGKTTLMQQLALARIGLRDQVLDWPVTETARRVLYLACDRPRQISRSFRRMVDERDRALLDERLAVWEGPPPYDFAKHPTVMASMCRSADADTVFVDSLKDVAIGLKEDEVGAAYNRARQLANAEGVQIVEAHHQTKRGSGQGPPNTLTDVYGSTWLTSGAGSVILLWGNPGDPIIDVRHLKQPANDVGPFKILHDAETGASSVWHATDLLQVARAMPNGLTARVAAQSLYGTEKPTPSDVEKARRRLEALTAQGGLTKADGDPATGTPTAYHPASRLPIGTAR